MARTRKADILSRRQRHREGIPGRDAPECLASGDWPEYYRRLDVRYREQVSTRLKAGWSNAPTYFHHSQQQER